MYKTCVLSDEETKKFSQLISFQCDKVILSKEKDNYYATIFSSIDITSKISEKILKKFF